MERWLPREAGSQRGAGRDGLRDVVVLVLETHGVHSVGDPEQALVRQVGGTFLGLTVLGGRVGHRQHGAGLKQTSCKLSSFLSGI